MNTPLYNYGSQPHYCTFPTGIAHINQLDSYQSVHANRNSSVEDYGLQPFVVNINEATKQNNTYRTALWTGKQLQVTLMDLNVGEDIGLEMHPNVDQFLRIEQWARVTQMGKSKEHLNFHQLSVMTRPS